MEDAVDRIRDDWAAMVPELDTEPAAVANRIIRAARILQGRADQVLAEHGLSRGEFDILSMLVRCGRPMTATELADGLWTSAPGTTKRLRKLRTAGFIEQTTNAADARSILVTPTVQGRRVLVPALAALSEVEAESLTALGTTERRRLERDLRRLLVELGDLP